MDNAGTVQEAGQAFMQWFMQQDSLQAIIQTKRDWTKYVARERPANLARFNPDSGEPVAGPAKSPLGKIQLEVRGSELYALL